MQTCREHVPTQKTHWIKTQDLLAMSPDAPNYLYFFVILEFTFISLNFWL